ncbi:MAG: ATP-binding protein [Halofilum sp. (in: g-proteobacteria)]|nr:ATP-binding protein [Halofilum sp. (in: g-proteobacteria)]
MAQYARLLAHTLPGEHDLPPVSESPVAPPVPGGDDLDLPYTTGHEYETRLTFQYWVGDRLITRSRYAPELERAPAEAGFHRVEHDGREWRVFTLALDDGRRVIVAEDEEVRDEIGLALATQALLPLVIGIPVLGLLLVLVINLATRRINAVAADVAERSPSDLAPVPTENAPRELAGLLQSINGLLERLRAGIEREKQFSADAAHELRTPITGTRLHLQNALMKAPDDADLHESLEQAELGIVRMAHIVEQLLRFNRAVNRDEAAEHEDVDLEAVIRDAATMQQPLLDRRGQSLSLQLHPARVAGNAELLGIVFGNLLANAGQYAPDEGRITVDLRRAGDRVVVTIEDSGPGIEAEFRESAFSRFRRGGDNGEPTPEVGCGLGLAIAKRICERHGATIELGDSEALGGLKVEVSLPANRRS